MGLFDFFIGKKFQLKVMLPKGVKIEHVDDKVTFIGTTHGISILAKEIQKIATLKDGQLAKVDRYIFKVSDSLTEDRFKANWIELPGFAWGVVASKFLEVTDKWEQNPFYFNSCGCIVKIPLDIGVEITDL